MSFILSFLLTFFFPVEKQDLSLKLEIGETYSQYYSSETQITQTIGVENQEIKMTLSGGTDFTVKSFENDLYLIDVAYNKLVMEMDAPGGKIIFSSEPTSDSTDIFSSIFRNMINKEFSIRMHKNGTIKEVINLDNVFSSVFDAFPEIPPAQRGQLISKIKEAYGEKAFKGNIEMMTAIFPDTQVDVGDSWNNSVKLESGMSSKLNNTFTYTEKSPEFLLITGESIISTANKDAYVDVNGMPTRYNLTGTMNSKIRIDPVTNWITSAEITQEMNGDMDIKDNPKLPGGYNIPMTIKTKMTVY